MPPAAAAMAQHPRGPGTRWKRSRALWDHARSSHHETVLQRVQAYGKAVLYELQPIRISQLKMSMIWEACQDMALRARCLQQSVFAISSQLQKSIYENASWKHAKILVGIVVYYMMVRAVHAYLDAGPIVIIVTILTLIFTIGLEEEDASQQQGERRRSKRELSAYSVFNRGFQRLLGSMDADEMLAQHLGGRRMYHDDDDDDHHVNNNNNARPARRNARQR